MSAIQTEVELIQLPAAAVSTKPSRRPSSARSGRSSAELTVNDTNNLERTDTTSTISSKSRTAVIIASVTLITTISTLLNGLTTVALPTIAKELEIHKALLLWPTSIQALTNGCSLLISGSLADALGARLMYLTGSILQVGFVLGCGLSQTSTELIVFRGLSGIALSLCLPSAVSIITRSFVGKRRNIAFAAMGGGQPIGFTVGLVLGGVLTDSIGWRWGFYISAIFSALICCVAIWGLPASIDSPPGTQGAADLSWATKWRQLKHDVDWIGAVIISTSLAMLSYVFA